MRPQDRENKLYQSGKRVQINIEEKILLDKYSEIFKKKKINILDIGCGSGEIMEKLNNLNAVTHGIDFSDEAINICKDKKLNASVGDLDSGIYFQNSYFEAVWAGDVLEHVFDPMYLIEEISRVLKKKGFLFFSIPNDLHLSKRLTVLFGQSFQQSYYEKLNIYKHHTFFSYDLLEFFLKTYNMELIEVFKTIRIPKLNYKFVTNKNFFNLFAMSYFGIAQKND